MKGKKCPVCKHFTLFVDETDWELTDITYCTFCEFQYDDRFDYNQDYDNMVKEHINKLQRRKMTNEKMLEQDIVCLRKSLKAEDENKEE